MKINLMEMNSNALFAFVFTVTLAFLSKLIWRKHPKQKLPPGPKPLLLIGNLNLITQNHHLSLHLLSQKYGSLMQLWFFNSPVVVVSSPDMAKLFLKTHDKVFASRPSLATGKYVNYNNSNLLWAPQGPEWREARKIFANEMLTTNRLDFNKHIRAEETCNFLSHLLTLAGKPVIIRDHISRHTLIVLARIVLGDEHFCESKNVNATLNLNELQGLIDEWFSLNGTFCIGDWLPCIGFLDVQGCVKRMKAYRKKFDNFIDCLIDDRSDNKAKNDFVPQDVLHSLLTQAADPNSENQLTRDRIKAIVQDTLTGGTDSTVITIEWAIHEICKQPSIMEKAKEELDRVIGRNRWVTENDFSQLPYLDAIVLESLRLHPPATILPLHYAVQNCNVQGYDITKGTAIIFNAWSVGRDPDAWDTPEVFMPERFLGKEIDLANNFTFLPFGSGRRMCPAYKLGIHAVRTTLANLLHGFDWKLPEGMKPEDVCTEEAFALTTRPKRLLSIILEPRLDANVRYEGNATTEHM